MEYFIPSASLNNVVSRFSDFNEETKYEKCKRCTIILTCGSYIDVSIILVFDVRVHLPRSSRTDSVSSSLHVSYQSHEPAWLAPAFGSSQAPVAAVALIVRPLHAVRDPNDADQQAMVWTEFTRIARKFEV
jgi:hypothetical protein